jgi:hypothetical protein
MTPTRGRPSIDPRRKARALEYGMMPHWLSDQLLDQLDACRSEEARRLLIYGLEPRKRRRPFSSARLRFWIRLVESV